MLKSEHHHGENGTSYLLKIYVKSVKKAQLTNLTNNVKSVKYS